MFAAETLFNQGLRVSLSHISERRDELQRGSHEVFDALGSRSEMRRDVLGIDYGVRPDFTLSALLPWVQRRFSSTAGTMRSSGPGDLTLLGKLRAHQQLWKRGSFNVAVIGGLELPTGSTSEHDGGVRLAPSLQPGGGSWNPFVAVSATLDVERLRFDARAFYKHNAEGDQDFERGDFVSFELDAAYRFLHTRYPGPTASARIGVQWRRQGRDQLVGAAVDSSGSTALWLRAGIGYHPTPATDLSLALDLPLHQHFHGTQLALHRRVVIAAGLRF